MGGGSCNYTLLPQPGRKRRAVFQVCRYTLIFLSGACGCIMLTLFHHFDAVGFGTDNVCVVNSTADFCYCEGTRLYFGSVVVFQPSNSFSCLFFCAFAAVVGALWLNRIFPSPKFLGLVDDLIDASASLYDGDDTTAGTPPMPSMRENEFSRGEARAWIYIMSLSVVGVMSWAKHALLDTVGGLLDIISMDFLMLCIFSTDAAQAVVDAGIWQTERFGGTGNITFFSLVVFLGVPIVMVRTLELEKATVGSHGMFAINITLAILVYFFRFLFERWKDGAWSRDISLFLVSLVSFLISIAFRETVCDPKSPWQGHAAWHFFSALAGALLIACHATHRRGFWCFERLTFVRLWKSFVAWHNSAPESHIPFFDPDTKHQETTSDGNV